MSWNCAVNGHAMVCFYSTSATEQQVDNGNRSFAAQESALDRRHLPVAHLVREADRAADGLPVREATRPKDGRQGNSVDVEAARRRVRDTARMPLPERIARASGWAGLAVAQIQRPWPRTSRVHTTSTVHMTGRRAVPFGRRRALDGTRSVVDRCGASRAAAPRGAARFCGLRTFAFPLPQTGLTGRTCS